MGFEDPHILLTGATGFLGKVVLSEILRTTPSARVTLLIRPRKSAGAERRLRSLRDSGCFAMLPDLERQFDSVSAVEGDLTASGCGLNPSTHRELLSSVTHVVHCAASIDFNLPIHNAMEANVVATIHLLEMIRAFPRLERVVTVSTAYVHPNQGENPIDEVPAPLPRDPERLFAGISRERVSEKELLRESGHPNTYTFTKCLCEHLVIRRFADLPLSIVRPSIISACWRHPFPGWIDSRAAFAAFVVAIGTGNLRSLLAHPETHMDIVPCDVVAGAILHELGTPDSGSHPGRTIPIRHATAGRERCMSIAVARSGIEQFFRAYPVEAAPQLFYLGTQMMWFRLGRLLEHRRRSFGVRGTRGKRRVEFMRKQTADLNRSFRYFTLHSFDFRSSLPDLCDGFRPDEYITTVCEGVHRHLLRRNRRRFILTGRSAARRDWAGRAPLRRPSLRYPLRSVRTLGLLRRLHRRLEKNLEGLTVDEISLMEVRQVLAGGGRIIFEPVEHDGVPGAAVSLLISYALLRRDTLGFGSLWLVGADEPRIVAARDSTFVTPHGTLFDRLDSVPTDAPLSSVGVRIECECDPVRHIADRTSFGGNGRYKDLVHSELPSALSGCHIHISFGVSCPLRETHSSDGANSNSGAAG